LNVAILILAAGEAKRMGHPDHHKLLALFHDEPLVRRVARQALASTASSVTVVMGHQSGAIAAALAGLAISSLHNPAYAEGMGCSLATGLCSPVIDSADGVLVMLADMPSVTSAHLDSLMAAFRSGEGRSVIRGCAARRPGHPVVLPRCLYGALRNLRGDVGARDVIVSSMIPVTLVEIGAAALQDIDTLDDLRAAGGRLAVEHSTVP
jgi:molybdenum cofactor cytidylyltransferase